jgi:triacylglycerol esterase/lipase EstA (alpha/beta hydrolase family)
MASRLRTAVVVAVSALLLAVGAPAVAVADPVIPSPAQAPTEGLEGANDFSCRPPAEHPRPVVLVHGTWADAQASWKSLVPVLKSEGYCVFALDYGYKATLSYGNPLNLFGGDDIAQSAQELGRFVDSVLATTGASQVDIVGHSQGGTLARQYMKFDGGADYLNPAANKVHTLVTLGATNHGTTYDSKQIVGDIAQQFGIPVTFVAAATVGPSAVQQFAGSPFMQLLNAGGDTMPGVDYTIIATHLDTVSTPPEATFLTAGAGATVDNVWVQDGCPSNPTTHATLPTDPRAMWMVMRGLDRSYADRVASPC